MISIYLYRIKLLDPLFYSREGLSASFTVPYLHATAVNLAIKSALNIEPQEQPYVITNDSVHRNNPRYKNSLVSDDFYFTPARLVSFLKYFPEITKGENDGFIFTTKRGELFQAGTLNYIPPESVFEGFLIEKKSFEWPKIIRLGSFRGKALLELIELEIVGASDSSAIVSHPVDPLITNVKRGIAISMFPYPIIENPECVGYVLVKLNDKKYKIAFPQEWELPKIEKIKTSKGTIIL